MRIKKEHKIKVFGNALGTIGILLFLISSCTTAPEEVAQEPTIDVYSAEKIAYISPANSPDYQDVFHAPYAIRTADEVEVQELEVLVTNQAGEAVYRSVFKSGEELPSEIMWHGRDTDARFVPNGTYTLTAEVTDSMQKSDTSDAFKIVVDNTAPEASAEVSLNVFSPNNDGNKDVLQIQQSGSEEMRWVGMVYNSNQEVIRSWKWTNTQPENITWDGTSQAGNQASDGQYRYVLKGYDRAGNSVSAETKPVTLSMESYSLTLTTRYRAFSPNGDNSKDTLPIMVKAPEMENITDWTLRLFDTEGNQLYMESGKNAPPKQVEMQGEIYDTELSEGRYRAVMQVTYRNGSTLTDETPMLSLDTTPPQAEVNVQSNGFSPDGDGKLETISFSQSVDQGHTWTGRILPAGEESPVMKLSWENDVPETFTWNGQNNSGSSLESGQYIYALQGRDKAGNTITARTDTFILDVQAPQLAASIENVPFTPDNDGNNDTLEFNIDAQDNFSIKSWKVVILDPKGKQFHTLRGTGIPEENVSWNGRAENGETVQSAEDYTARITVRDRFENSSSEEKQIPVGILVVQEPNGDYNIRITSIRFVPFEADYKNLEDQTMVEQNMQTLDRLAVLLKEYPDHKIRIEGHAVHLFYGDEELRAEEQQDTLLPLSRDRAEVIKTALAERGVEADRITTAGRGGSEPVVPHSDMDDRWKNRRVEFELIKQ